MPSSLAFHDLLGTDEMLLGMIPQPVQAVVMLFPIKDVSEKHCEVENKRIETDGQVRREVPLFHVESTDSGF